MLHNFVIYRSTVSGTAFRSNELAQYIPQSPRSVRFSDCALCSTQDSVRQRRYLVFTRHNFLVYEPNEAFSSKRALKTQSRLCNTTPLLLTFWPLTFKARPQGRKSTWSVKLPESSNKKIILPAQSTLSFPFHRPAAGQPQAPRVCQALCQAHTDTTRNHRLGPQA